MSTRRFLHWFRGRIQNYNLFIPDEDDYDDDEARDPATIIKHQQYSTRLYVPLLMSK